MGKLVIAIEIDEKKLEPEVLVGQSRRWQDMGIEEAVRRARLGLTMVSIDLDQFKQEKDGRVIAEFRGWEPEPMVKKQVETGLTQDEAVEKAVKAAKELGHEVTVSQKGRDKLVKITVPQELE